MSEFRCGLVSLAGRSNVGKSTLLNAMVGEKVSIVTHKPQTTRYRLTGIRNTPQAQILFIDTPGLHRSAGKALNRVMNKTALQTLAEGDVILFVLEAFRWTDEDQDLLGHFARLDAPVIAVANKADLVKPREALLPKLEQLSKRYDFSEIVPVSALRRDNLDALAKVIIAHLPEGPALYPSDQSSDRGETFHVAEIIREQLTLRLQQELPYGVQVKVEAINDSEKLVHISAVIWVERVQQKAIVIGKGGRMLKGIGSVARRELEQRLGKQVNLDLWVKVRDKWSDNVDDLQRFGYDV